MKKLLVATTLVGVALALLVQLQAQDGAPRVGQIQVGGSPTVSDADAVGPVPRLPDNTVDITGPWVRGGSNSNMEADGARDLQG